MQAISSWLDYKVPHEKTSPIRVSRVSLLDRRLTSKTCARFDVTSLIVNSPRESHNQSYGKSAIGLSLLNNCQSTIKAYRESKDRTVQLAGETSLDGRPFDHRSDLANFLPDHPGQLWVHHRCNPDDLSILQATDQR